MVWPKVRSELQSLKRHIKATRDADLISFSILLGSSSPMVPEPHENLQPRCLVPVTCSALWSSLLPRNKGLVFCLTFPIFRPMPPSSYFLTKEVFFLFFVFNSNKTPDHFLACWFPCLFFLTFSHKEYFLLSFFMFS